MPFGRDVRTENARHGVWALKAAAIFGRYRVIVEDDDGIGKLAAQPGLDRGGAGVLEEETVVKHDTELLKPDEWGDRIGPLLEV